MLNLTIGLQCVNNLCKYNYQMLCYVVHNVFNIQNIEYFLYFFFRLYQLKLHMIIYNYLQWYLANFIVWKLFLWAWNLNGRYLNDGSVCLIN